tara:strand:- start:95387 stop:95881 length:495 start_codon:yes stop_codon:yes gene_type:complete
MQGHLLKRAIIVATVLLNFGCDQFSKDMVRTHVGHMEYKAVVRPFLILTNVENTGAMYGFGADFSPVVKILLLQVLPMLVLLAILIRIVVNRKLGPWTVFAFACVIGGGLGNLVDRIARGSVTDFFQFRVGPIRSGIFNMADVSVTLGVLFILALTLQQKKIQF